jgi:hypothetical protein
MVLTDDQRQMMCRFVGEEFAAFLPRFVSGMADRMIVSAHKYGRVTPDVPKQRDMLATIRLRLQKYQDTHNTEFLMDVANFCVMEGLFPSFDDAHFKPTDSHESPGLVGHDGSVLHSVPDAVSEARRRDAVVVSLRRPRSGD